MAFLLEMKEVKIEIQKVRNNGTINTHMSGKPRIRPLAYAYNGLPGISILARIPPNTQFDLAEYANMYSSSSEEVN